ncbi:DUF1622 domain-containing protein [Devosia sp.]|uniref:DUF1622 domain-containing protein n=1 Tax=Devosia sp. TaxID=1871048 RepID=UPI003A9224D9
MQAMFFDALELITVLIEALGVVAILAGIVIAGVGMLRDRGRQDAYHRMRSTLGRAILLGLELLVAADIINTVAIEPSLGSLGILAGVVLIRTFLSLSLEVEIEGRWPWRRNAPSNTTAPNRS